MTSVFEILRDNWLLLLIGQYPNGPLGGIACTLILSVLGIVLAFPLSVALALARLSPWRLLNWPATALVNHSVSLFKNSSLAMAIGVAELTHAVKEIESQSFRTFEAYLLATLMYLGFSLLIMFGGALLERRTRISGAR